MKKKYLFYLIHYIFIYYKFTLQDCGGRNSGKPIVEILIWSGSSWAGFTQTDFITEPNYLGHEVDKRKWNCPIDCRFIVDKKRVANVDAVIFEAQPITSYFNEYKRSPPKFPMKYPFQIWVNHGYETHIYFHLYSDPGYLNYIDANFTFSLQSAVPITFTCLWGGGNISDFLKPPPPKSKNKCVAFMTTNCGAGGAIYRTAYVKELMNYIHIDSYGKCLHNKDFPKDMQFPIYSNHGASMRNKIFIFKDYKFVLTFENNNVTDYVTEKLPNVLQAGSVPVYMGAPNVHPDWTPGEHSIVKTDDFSGPKKLAEYLKNLCNNDEEYYKFFEWKKKGLSPQFQQRLSDCVFYGAECRLCKYIYEQRNKLTNEQQKNIENRKVKSYIYQILQFNGNYQYIEIQGNNKLNLKNEFTISMWINPNNIDQILLDRKIYSLRLKKIWERGYVQLCVKDICYEGTHPINLGTGWYHIVVIFKYNEFDKQINFFINGCEDKNIEIPLKYAIDNDYNDNLSLYIGSNINKTEFYNGQMDDISIWNIAISKKKAINLVFESLSGLEENLVAYFSFDEIKNENIVDVTNSTIAILKGNPEWKEMISKPLVTVNSCI